MKSFKEKQQACYQLWKEWLSPNGFYRNLYRHFEKSYFYDLILA
jgi:hypothetical protein